MSAGDGSVERPSQGDRDEHTSNVADVADRSAEGNGLARESVGVGGVGQRSEEDPGVGLEDVAAVDVRAKPGGRCCHCVG